GVDLAEQMTRDNVEVPPIVEKCAAAIEKYGMELQGIYRLSGTTSKVQKLKEQLDRGMYVWCPVSVASFSCGKTDLEAVNLDTEEWPSDINTVASVLQLWIR